MATGAANDLRSLAHHLAAVPDEAVTELTRWFVPRSEQVGGTMIWFGKRVRLSSKIKSRKHTHGTTSVLLIGTPVSCWSIKSHGRRGNYPVKPRRKQALSLKAFAPGAIFARTTVHRAVSGDNRWNRLVAETDIRFFDIVDSAVDRAVR